MKIEYPPVPDNAMFYLNELGTMWVMRSHGRLRVFASSENPDEPEFQLICDHMYRCWIDIAHGLGEKCDESDAITKYGIDQHRCHVTGYRDAHINAELWRKLGKEMK